MLIILEGLSAAQRRALLPALRRLLEPDTLWETVPPHAELFGRPRLERLLTAVNAYEPHGASLVLDGWILAPRPTDEWSVRQDHALRALALARLAQLRGAVLLRGRSDPLGDASRFNLWNDLLPLMPPTSCNVNNCEGVLQETLAKTFPGDTADLARIQPQGIGHPHPRVVLIGEGTSKNTWCGLPFSGGPAAALVRQALRGHGDCYLLNAAGGVEEPPPESELRFLAHRHKPPRFLALGKEAGKLLTRLKIEHVLLLHPVHVERFHSADVVNWVAHLRTLLEKP